MSRQVSLEEDGALDKLLATAIEVFGLTVDASCREEARNVLGVIAASAMLIQSVNLGDHAEPATVYRA